MQLHDDVPACVGHFRLEVRRNGELIEVMDEPNIIVTGSKQVLAKLLGGLVSGQSVTQIGFGTSLAAAAAGNSALTGQYAKALDSVNYPAADKVQFNFSLGSGEANGMGIGEFGLLTAGATLFARKVRTSLLNKESDLSFTGSWTIQFN